MENAFSKFEFNRIEEKLASFAITDIGKQDSLSLHQLRKEELAKEKAMLLDVNKVIARYGRFPLSPSSDLSKPVELALKGGVLTELDLERVASDALYSESMIRFISLTEDDPLLKEYAKGFPTLSYLPKDIHKVIAPDLTVFDSASPKLRGIRAAKKKVEAETKKKLGSLVENNENWLTGSMLTMRNGHYVLPVSTSYKTKVKGIFQDVSGSGETTFIEPEEIVALNNKMVELSNDEKAEIHRLLGELSKEVAASSEGILLNNKMLGYLDFMEAKSLYGSFIKGVVAEDSVAPLVKLLGARHPLLDQNKVIPNDIIMTPDKRILIISGPNAGGKTVALKTLGTLILMNECGLPIPALEGSVLSYFSNVYVDIGDNQSLSDNLSTFSAHIASLSSFLNLVGGKDLVLLDELGTGTAPKEGEALAISIIHFLLRKCAFAMVSSHFEGLKALALSTEGLINCSMIFDKEKMAPTYRLRIGLPGESYGIEVAERLGLPSEIMDEAKKNLSSSEDVSISKAIDRLSNEASKAEEERKKSLAKEAELSSKLKAVESREAALGLREKNYLEDVEKKKDEMIASYKKEVSSIIKDLSRPDLKLHEAIEAKKRIDDLSDKALVSGDTYPEVSLGDYVNIPSAYVSGRVTQVSGKKITVTSKEGLSFLTVQGKAIKVEAPKEEPRTMTSSLKLDDLAFAKSLPMELNMIGMHVDEGEIALDKYLDECRLKGYKRVRIIHGWGSGALRTLVRQYCDRHTDFIKTYQGADGTEGGGGATIVFLK